MAKTINEDTEVYEVTGFDEDAEVVWNYELLQAPDARIRLRRVFDNSGLGRDGFDFGVFIAYVEESSGVKIPNLH